MVENNRRITIEEALKLPPDHPDVVALREQIQRDREQLVERLGKELAPVRTELVEMGLSGVDDLMLFAQRNAPLPPAVMEVVLRRLSRVEDDAARQILVRMLAATVAAFDGSGLVRVFESTHNDSLRWAIANTMASANPRGIEDWIIGALRNPASGNARQMLATAAARLAPATAANEALLQVFDELPGHAAMGLAISGGREELEFLEARRTKGKAWEKKEIQKAISKITKRLLQQEGRLG